MRPAARCLLTLAMAAASAAVMAQAAAYTIDPTHTFASFEFDTGLSTWRVRFDRRQGRIELDRAGRRGAVEISVDMASVSSGLPALDERLRGTEFFDVARFPVASFTSERFGFEGDRLSEVAGTLTLRGLARPVVLKAVRFDCYFNPLFRREVCGGDFEALLESRDWDLSASGDRMLPERVRLLVQVEAIRQ